MNAQRKSSGRFHFCLVLAVGFGPVLSQIRPSQTSSVPSGCLISVVISATEPVNRRRASRHSPRSFFEHFVSETN